MCDIIMLIFGIIALVRGKFLLTRAKEVRGVPARIIGIVLMIPLPLSFVAGLALGAMMASQGKSVDDLRLAGSILGVTITGLCFVSAIAIAVATARPIVKAPAAARGNASVDEELPGEYGDHFRAGASDTGERRTESDEFSDRPARPRQQQQDDRIQE
jgi:hypothetical protein